MGPYGRADEVSRSCTWKRLLQTPMCGSRDRRLIFAVPREAQTARGAKASAEVKASCARTAIPLHPHVRCRVEALRRFALRGASPRAVRSRLLLPDCHGESEHSAICQLPLTDTRQPVLVDRELCDPTRVPNRKKCPTGVGH